MHFCPNELAMLASIPDFIYYAYVYFKHVILKV